MTHELLPYIIGLSTLKQSNTDNRGIFMIDKEFFLRMHKDKSVDELRVIVHHNSAAIYSVDADGAKTLLAESEACAELLKQKTDAAAYMQQENINRMYSLNEWEKANSARRKKAILNLPAGTSYNGQLVVAVLDDAAESLTAAEIRQWSDELTAIEDGEYQKLLNALCNEEVLCCTQDGKYSILSFCTPDLQRTNAMLWLKKRLNYDKDSYIYSEDKKKLAFFQRIIDTKQPVTEVDWIECTWIDYRKKQVADNPQFHYGRAAHELSEFVKNGVLSITPIRDSDLHYYYFTMLGEKEGE